MSKDPAFLFYTQDFYTGTVFMTDEQVGKYVRLLCLQHQTGHLEEKHMLNICKTYDVDIFSKFIRDDKGLYYNERLDKEINRRVQYCESRRKNKLSEKTYVQHMETENMSSVINNTIVSFEKFWNLYDIEEDRILCETLWMQLDNTDRVECMTKLSEYIKSTPDKQFRKSPKSFIKNKAWRNEIIKRNGSPQTEIIIPKFSSGPGR